MEFEHLTQEHKEELKKTGRVLNTKRRMGGRSNQQRISEMKEMIEEQDHVIAALRADTDNPTLTPPPPLVSQASRKPLQNPSGFNQHQ